MWLITEATHALTRMRLSRARAYGARMSSEHSTESTRTVSPKPQPWRWSHPRVLIEHPDEAEGLAIASRLRFAGYAVTICPGPAGHGQCPLVGPAGCAPAHDADLVVCCLGYERGAARKILRELR